MHELAPGLSAHENTGYTIAHAVPMQHAALMGKVFIQLA